MLARPESAFLFRPDLERLGEAERECGLPRERRRVGGVENDGIVALLRSLLSILAVLAAFCLLLTVMTVSKVSVASQKTR